MEMDKNRIQKEVDDNFEFFKSKLNEIITDHEGKFALIKNQEIKGYFDKSGDALVAGKKKYPDGVFSIQEVTKRKISFGILDYAIF